MAPGFFVRALPLGHLRQALVGPGARAVQTQGLGDRLAGFVDLAPIEQGNRQRQARAAAEQRRVVAKLVTDVGGLPQERDRLVVPPPWLPKRWAYSRAVRSDSPVRPSISAAYQVRIPAATALHALRLEHRVEALLHLECLLVGAAAVGEAPDVLVDVAAHVHEVRRLRRRGAEPVGRGLGLSRIG